MGEAFYLGLPFIEGETPEARRIDLVRVVDR